MLGILDPRVPNLSKLLLAKKKNNLITTMTTLQNEYGYINMIFKNHRKYERKWVNNKITNNNYTQHAYDCKVTVQDYALLIKLIKYTQTD